MTALGFPRLNGRLSLIIPLVLSLALAAGCSGGGGSAPQGTVGPAAVAVSVAPSSSADTAAFASGAVSAGAAATAAADLQPASAFPTLEHVWVTVSKIALMPVEGSRPTLEGEDVVEDSGQDWERETGKHSPFVVLVPPPGTRFDLLNPPDKVQLAKFLNKFDSVPAGTYGKIRVYYTEVDAEVQGGTTVPFHPTAHYHFDIHFVGGRLVIPASTDLTAPDGWIRFVELEIRIVGLKIGIVGKADWTADGWVPRGNGGKLKVILRPQVFARFVPPIRYSIAGTASGVAPGSLDVAFDAKSFHVQYNGGTSWSFSDNVLGGGRIVGVSPDRGALALRNGAIVEAVGLFAPGSSDFTAEQLYIGFPDRLFGKVYLGWAADNTFSVRRPAGDNTVFPQPSRADAIYDNAVSFLPLTQAAIVDNVTVTARGYEKFVGGVPVGVEAFWISIAP